MISLYSHIWEIFVFCPECFNNTWMAVCGMWILWPVTRIAAIKLNFLYLLSSSICEFSEIYQDEIGLSAILASHRCIIEWINKTDNYMFFHILVYKLKSWIQAVSPPSTAICRTITQLRLSSWDPAYLWGHYIWLFCILYFTLLNTGLLHPKQQLPFQQIKTQFRRYWRLWLSAAKDFLVNV